LGRNNRGGRKRPQQKNFGRGTIKMSASPIDGGRGGGRQTGKKMGAGGRTNRGLTKKEGGSRKDLGRVRKKAQKGVSWIVNSKKQGFEKLGYENPANESKWGAEMQKDDRKGGMERKKRDLIRGNL